MEYNNACELNDESRNNLLTNTESNVEHEQPVATLLDISDLALLRVFSFLNLKDSINLAETCVRLSRVGNLYFIKFKRFDLLKYEHLTYVFEEYYCRYDYLYDDVVDDSDEDEEKIERLEPIEIEKVLFHIGQHIKTLSIDSVYSSVREDVMKYCVNVESLKIYEIYHDDIDLNKWISELNLDSLTLKNFDHVHEMFSVSVATLKELKFNDGNRCLSATELFNILDKTEQLERLEVEIYYPDFNYGIFGRLSKLQCLQIKIETNDLVKIAEFLKFDQLTQLKLFLPMNVKNDTEFYGKLNGFLELLAKNGKLNELQLYVSHVNNNTFQILKQLQVSTLQFYALIFDECQCSDYDNDCCMMHKLSSTLTDLKHLDFLRKYVSVEHMVLLITNLLELETLTVHMDEDDLEELIESKVDELLKTSNSRPMLTLCINMNYRNSSVKIILSFKDSNKRIIHSDNGHKAGDSYFLTDDFAGQICCC